jgi:tetrapyrrole methylase family protein/MazG family protein
LRIFCETSFIGLEKAGKKPFSQRSPDSQAKMRVKYIKKRAEAFMEDKYDFNAFSGIMDRLLAEDGCPWDKIQTHETLRQYMLEESYEAVDAINNGDMPALCEELGDVLLEVVFHAKIAEKAGEFTLDDVIHGISKKMITRHRHIFGTDIANTPEEVLVSWENIKKEEKNYKSVHEDMIAVPKALPALIRAEKVLKRSGIRKELNENDKEKIALKLNNLLNETNFDSSELLFGDMLLDIVRLARFLEINTEFSLTNAIEKFINRFEDGKNPIN